MVGGAPDRAHLLAVGARAIRAQTFSLAARDFVNLARLSGRGTIRVIVNEIAPNMSSYLFLTFILLFGGLGAHRGNIDFLGLGPSQVHVARADDEHRRVRTPRCNSAWWWWFIPPGNRDHRGIVGGLYVMNVGLDEVFDPKLRNTLTLAVDNLRVYYRTLKGDVQALDGVTFAVADGEIMGLAGRVGVRQDDPRQEPDPSVTY